MSHRVGTALATPRAVARVRGWTAVATALWLFVVGCAPAQPGPHTPAHQASQLPAELRGSGHVRALLVSGDDEARHQQNLRDARRALIARGLANEDIETSSPSAGAGTKHALRDAIQRLARKTRDGDGWLLYVTGHGTPQGIGLSDGLVSHDELLRWLAPLANKRAVVVFDGCYTGGLPWRLMEAGFEAYAMAPVSTGHASYCQLFAPHLWEALERGLDSNGDGTPSFREAFRFALGVYQQKLQEAELPPASGAWARPLPELENLARLKKGAALVQLTAKGCQPCVVQRQRLALLSALLDDIELYTLDIGGNPHANELSQMDGMPAIDAVPTLLFVLKGRVVHVRRGLTDSSTLLADASQKLGLAQSLTTTVDGLEANLNSEDRERAAFALRALLELDRTGGRVLETFRRGLKSHDTRLLVPLVEAVRYTRGYAALLAKIDAGERRALGELLRTHRRNTLREGLHDLASSDDGTRGAALLALWRLAGAHDVEPDDLAVLLTPLAELHRHGDEEQRRLAQLLLATLAERFAEATVRFAFEGVDEREGEALRRDLAAHQTPTLLVYGAMAIEAHYADHGHLRATASPTSARFHDGTLTLSFAVRPGPRYLIHSSSAVELNARDEAVTPLGSKGEIDALALMPRGSLASRLAIAARVQAIEAHYQNAGYAEASVRPDIDMRDDGTCNVTLRIQRGALRHFGRVEVVGGDVRLRSRVRASANIRPGELYRLRRLEAVRKRIGALVDDDDLAMSTTIANDGRIDVSIEIKRAR